MNWSVVETPLSVAVIVTGVGTVTCPSGIWKSVQAKPGIVIVAGTGATAGFELVRVTVAPPAGTAAVSCSAIEETVAAGHDLRRVDALERQRHRRGGRRADRERAGRRRRGDGRQAGDCRPWRARRSPWVEKTRQYFVPGVRELMGTDGKCCWTPSQFDVLERRVLGDLDGVAEDLRVGHVRPLERDRQRHGLPADGGQQRRRRPDRGC